MRYIRLAVRIIDATNDWIGKILSLLIVPLAFLTGYEVVQRYVFSTPSIWIEEAVLLAYGGYIVLGGAYALRHNAHVNVDILSRHWSPKTNAIVDIVTFPFFLFFVGLLLWKGGEMAWTSIQNLEHSQSSWRPIVYPVKALIPIAAFLVLLQGTAQLARNVYLVMTGRELR